MTWKAYRESSDFAQSRWSAISQREPAPSAVERAMKDAYERGYRDGESLNEWEIRFDERKKTLQAVEDTFKSLIWGERL